MWECNQYFENLPCKKPHSFPIRRHKCKGGPEVFMLDACSNVVPKFPTRKGKMLYLHGSMHLAIIVPTSIDSHFITILYYLTASKLCIYSFGVLILESCKWKHVYGLEQTTKRTNIIKIYGVHYQSLEWLILLREIQLISNNCMNF